jgi:hypothetical protein
MSDLAKVPNISTGTYCHYKDKLYEVLGVALHSETQEVLVVYKPLYESIAELWVRPYDMFVENVIIDGKSVARFQKIED